MDRDKAVQECANQFMIRTGLCDISWQEGIVTELRDVLEMLYGVGYDRGRDEILFHQAREVLQMGEYGNILGTFKSVAQAAKAFDGDPGNIRAVLNSRQHTAYGYQWRYTDSFFDQTTKEPPTDEENIS